MVWMEDDEDTANAVATCEVALRVDCPRLPVDHGHALYSALCAELPWLAGEPDAGIHAIHGGASGNGWTRPETEAGGDGVLHLSRRARLVLRVPRARVGSCLALSGTTLDVAGHRLRIGQGQPRDLRAEPTQFARGVVSARDEDEAAFEARLLAELAARGVRVRKLMCGRIRQLRGETSTLTTRSVLLADLAPWQALAVQERCVGGHGHLGCGLFMPHKSIAAVNPGAG